MPPPPSPRRPPLTKPATFRLGKTGRVLLIAPRKPMILAFSAPGALRVVLKCPAHVERTLRPSATQNPYFCFRSWKAVGPPSITSAIEILTCSESIEPSARITPDVCSPATS